MNLITLGEAVKNLDKVSDGELLPKYNQIQWGEGNVQWTFPIALAEKQTHAFAFCQKQKPADSNTAGKASVQEFTLETEPKPCLPKQTRRAKFQKH